MTKSEIETAKRELDHALGAFEEWSKNPAGWPWAAARVTTCLCLRDGTAGVAFFRARLAAAGCVGLDANEEAVRYMRRLAPVFLDLLIEQAEP